MATLPMITVTTTAMPTDARLLTLIQWLSPSFPIGAFAYSHGLEAAVDAGWISDADTLQEWLSDVALHGSGRCDAIWLRLAYETADGAALLALNNEAFAFAPSATRQNEVLRQGAAFAQTVNAVWDIALPDLLLPLAVGAAARTQEMDVEAVTPLYLHAFLSNLIASAQRLLPVGQTAGQRILAALQSEVADITDQTRNTTSADIHSSAFLSDIAAMRHDTLDTRLFQS